MWGLRVTPPPLAGAVGAKPPQVLGFPPPPSAAVPGHRAASGPHALGTGRRRVPASALAHGRRPTGGRGADLRDPSHSGGTASDARPGRGLGLASFLGGALGIPGGASGMRQLGGVGILVRQGIPTGQILPPKGAPRTEADALAQILWHSTRWCHVLVGLGRGADSLHAQVAYGVSAHKALNRTFWSHATQYVERHGTGLQLVGGGGTATLTFITRCGHRRPSWRPS